MDSEGWTFLAFSVSLPNFPFARGLKRKVRGRAKGKKGGPQKELSLHLLERRDEIDGGKGRKLCDSLCEGLAKLNRTHPDKRNRKRLKKMIRINKT